MIGTPEDHDRDEQRCVEEVGVRAVLVVRPPADGDRGDGEQQPEEQRAGIAHEDPSRVEVVGQEPDADPDRDHRDQRRDVRALEEAVLEESVRVEEQRGARDDHDARGEAVQTVDEVDRVGEDDDDDHRDQRSEIRGEHDRVLAGEGHPEEEHRDAEQGQEAPGQHHPGDLGRGRDVPEVVERTDREHHAGPEHEPGRLR